MRLIIQGEPVAKKRPRFSTFRGFIRAYDSQEKEKTISKHELCHSLEQWLIENQDREKFKSNFNFQKIVSLWFLLPICQSATNALRNRRLWGFDRVSRCDLDNYIKYILDISNGNLWHDDSQIVELHAYQHYSENPCTIIEIEDIKINMSEDSEKLLRLFSPLALEKFESDLGCLRNCLEALRLSPRSERQQNLDTASEGIKNFSSTYGFALKKMISK